MVARRHVARAQAIMLARRSRSRSGGRKPPEPWSDCEELNKIIADRGGEPSTTCVMTRLQQIPQMVKLLGTFSLFAVRFLFVRGMIQTVLTPSPYLFENFNPFQE